MKKFATAFFVSFMSVSSVAQDITCLDKLLPFSRHSGLHMLTKEEWNDGTDFLTAENAMVAFNSLINRKLLCKSDEVVVAVQPTCQQVIADIPQSNVCFLHTNVGYFVLSRDNGKNVNFIFSRDKTFTDMP